MQKQLKKPISEPSKSQLFDPLLILKLYKNEVDIKTIKIKRADTIKNLGKTAIYGRGL